MAENEMQHVEAVAVTANALEQMERASIDIQIATAKKYPRSMDLFYKRATAMVTFDAETAASCLYRRVVGKEGGKMIFAEGESIRLAEIVAASYGNLRVAGMIIEMEPRYVKAVGIAHDLESNYAVKKEVVESTVNRHGQPFSERMRVVVAKSAQSKAIRDATFSVVPKSLCKPLVSKAKDVAKGDIKTFEAKQKAVVTWIKSLKIKPKRVWDAIGIKGEADISVEVLLLLAGIRTAIEEGDCTINEAFPKPEAEQKGSTTERIIKGFDKEPDKTEPEKPTEKPTRKPRSDKGTKRDKKSEQSEEAAPEQPTEPESDPTPPQKPKTEHQPEETPTTVGKDEWKCLRCGRKLKDNDRDINNGQCAHCMGNIVGI